MTYDNRARPLSGYRILDFTSFLSGPFCTQILADLGAQVVKIEPIEGDSSRHVPPHFVGDDSAYFLSTNRGKLSIAVDLKNERALALVKLLIAKADVVIENYRPGVAAKLGLDKEVLCAENTRLIWASITGFGQTGPWSRKPAYDMIVQALSGVMSLTGEEGRPSVRLGIPAGDVVAGMYAAIAINAALVDRERRGKGRVIDVAMLDSLLTMLSYQAEYALVAGVVPKPQGAAHDSIPTYRSFRAGDDRELVVTANTERMWKGLCSTLDLVDLVDDARFANAKARLNNKDELWTILEKAFLDKSAAEWVHELELNDVPAALVQTVPQALDDARAADRDMVIRLSDAAGQSAEFVGCPIKFPNSETPQSTYPPALGADGATVLEEWLGMKGPDVDILYDQGALHARNRSS